jgi:hypothetical protein
MLRVKAQTAPIPNINKTASVKVNFFHTMPLKAKNASDSTPAVTSPIDAS